MGRRGKKKAVDIWSNVIGTKVLKTVPDFEHLLSYEFNGSSGPIG